MPENVEITRSIRRYYYKKRQITVNVTIRSGNITAELAEKDSGGVYRAVQVRSASAGRSMTLSQSRTVQKDWRLTLSGQGVCDYSVTTS